MKLQMEKGKSKAKNGNGKKWSYLQWREEKTKLQMERENVKPPIERRKSEATNGNWKKRSYNWKGGKVKLQMVRG